VTFVSVSANEAQARRASFFTIEWKGKVVPMNGLYELKPCPFCGSHSVALVGLEVRCGTCSAVGPFGVDAEQAVTRWNERDKVKPWEAPYLRKQKIAGE